jgi:hypothetical protein
MPLPKPANFKETTARDTDLHRRMRGRNLAIFAALIVLMIVIFLVTYVRIQTGMEAAG